MPVANGTVIHRTSRGPRRGQFGSAAGAQIPLPKPLRWYVDWVRANEENAQSLERLSRTFAMIVSDPSDLINMEGCWTLSKLHSFVNQSILQTNYRTVSASEVLTYILRAVQELEGLGELLLRKYCTQHSTWNVLLALQSVKCVLNLCVHRQFFLMPWVWHSVRLYLRRVLRALWIPRYFLPGARRKAIKAGDGSNAVSNRLYGQTVGPNGARLVIPRVVSSRRGEHQHYFNPAADQLDDEEAAWEKEMTEAIPFTFIDVLGMVVDAYLLVRPVLVVAAARHAFPATGGEDIAKIPTKPKNKASSGSAAVTETVPAPKKALTTEERKKAAEEEALNNFHVLRATMQASSAQQTLFSNWRWWALFASLDALVVLLARCIRARRIPVVYLDEPSAAQALQLEGSSNSGRDEAEEQQQQSSIVNGDGDNVNAANPTPAGSTDDVATTTAAAVTANEPAVVSRDSLRLQQAMRNMSYTFLRDPFFTIVLKEFIFKHFVTGFVNKVPLLGSLVAFQVGYFLSMQHYSFLYSLGQ